MKGKKTNVVNDFMNNLSNNVNFKINKVDSMVDMLSVSLIVIILALVGMDVKIPQESKMAFLLALIILVSCYSIDIAIVVAVIAIIYVLIQNNNATEGFKTQANQVVVAAAAHEETKQKLNEAAAALVLASTSSNKAANPPPAPPDANPSPAPPNAAAKNGANTGNTQFPAPNAAAQIGNNAAKNGKTQFPTAQPANATKNGNIPAQIGNIPGAAADATPYDLYQDELINKLNLKIDPQYNPGLNSLVNEINQNMEELISQLKNEQWESWQIAEALANAGFSIEKITKFLIDEGLPQEEIDGIKENISQMASPYGLMQQTNPNTNQK